MTVDDMSIRMRPWTGSFLLVEDIIVAGQPLCVVRDDLFPFVGGGSKARKAVFYERLLRQQGFDAVVTCGGVQSNHCRAIALMCARNGWKCHLCVQGTEERFFAEKGNAQLIRLSGADVEFIRPEQTAVAMDSAMERLAATGYKPYYCHGGGHDLPGGQAFVEAVKMLAAQAEQPDYIFHASGTGSTQAAIIVGLELAGWGSTSVVGISVARKQERGRQAVADFCQLLARHYGLEQDFSSRIIFSTDYLAGGYEGYSPPMENFLREVMKTTGLMLDTTYSGKAFYGMTDYVKTHGLQGKRLLFWHTGGLMNIMR